MAPLLTETYLLRFQASHVDTKKCLVEEVGLFPPVHIYLTEKNFFQNMSSLVTLCGNESHAHL